MLVGKEIRGKFALGDSARGKSNLNVGRKGIAKRRDNLTTVRGERKPLVIEEGSPSFFTEGKA